MSRIWVKIEPSLAKSHSLYGLKNWLAVFAFGLLLGVARELADVSAEARRAGISLTELLAGDHPTIAFLKFAVLTETCVVAIIYWLLFTRSPHLRKAASGLLMLSWPLIAVVGLTTQDSDVGQGLALSLFSWIISCAAWVPYLNLSKRVRVTFENCVLERDSIIAGDESKSAQTMPMQQVAAAFSIEPAMGPNQTSDIVIKSNLTSRESEWEAALIEFEGDGRKKGLWAKCFANADGDESRAKAMYLRERAA